MFLKRSLTAQMLPVASIPGEAGLGGLSGPGLGGAPGAGGGLIDFDKLKG